MKEALCALQIELTNTCQLSCAECPRRFMTRQVGNMDFELAKLLIDEGLEYKKDMGFNLNGIGEPLLYPHLSELIYYMAEKGVKHYDLFTNLAVNSNSVYSVFKAISETPMDVTLAISMHLYDDSGNLHKPTEANFDKNFGIITELIENKPNVHTHISMIDTKYHTEDIIAKFHTLFRTFLLPENIHVIRQLNPWFDLVKDMAGKNGYDLGCVTPSVCDYPFILFHVGWDGKVIICCTDDVNEECVLGEVKEKGDLRKIWHGEKLEQIRKDFNEYKINIAPCNRCHRTLFARKEK